jgi:folliculin
LTFYEREEHYVVSSHHPINYSNLRNSCVRALSCELSPGKEGPVLFGTSLKNEQFNKEENNQEWTLSFVFKLKDIKARGYTRVYTLLLILQDFPLLLSIYDLIIKSFERLITDMQCKSDSVFNSDWESQELQSSSHRAPLRTHGVFRREAGSNYLRPLTELVNDPNYFVYLHSYFGWLIQSIHLKINQKLIQLNNISGDMIYSSIYNTILSLPNVQFLQCYSDIYYAMGADAFRCLLWNLFIGNQIILKTETKEEKLIQQLVTLIEV